MELSKKLKSQGWYLTEDGIKKVIAAAGITESAAEQDVRKIIATALDMDFRDISGGALPAKRDDTTFLPGRIVLQVQRVRNISAPKSNEDSKTAPRFLQLDLSDGQLGQQALELEVIPALSLNIPPGTKIYFTAERLQLMQGFLVLRAAELQVLGGRVEPLVEKWELARTMQKYAKSGRRMSGTGGPPPWIAFGKKSDAPKETLPNLRNFKSLQAASEKDKETKENEEFNTMRSEAIAEATKKGAKKVFGGGGQQILDHNVKKILEKGYSEEDAQHALRSTNNNLERALYNLKRRQDFKRNDDTTRSLQVSGSAKVGFKRGAASAKEEAIAAKPAANVSLFDFLTDKLPTNTETTATSTASATKTNQPPAVTSAFTAQKFEKSKSDVTKSNYNSNSNKQPESNSRPKFENNISSSFQANRFSGPPRGGRGGSERPGRSGRPERDIYNNSEHSSNSRFGGGARGGSRGARGGASSSYQQSNNRPSHEERNNRNRNEGGGSDQKNLRSTNYNQSNRNNRASHERSTNINERGQQEGAGAAHDNNKRGNNYQQNRGTGGEERYGHFNENKNRRESSNKNYDSGKGNSTNNNSNNATAKTLTTASASVSNSNTNNNSNGYNARMNNLIESTSKLKIDKNREQGSGGRNRPHQQKQQQEQQRQPNQSQQQYSQAQMQQTQHQQPPILSQHYATQQFMPAAHSQQNQNTFSQLPNGFTYDPSKIIGFQNKETNEFAMTLLKSQGLSSAATSTQQQPQQQQHHSYVPAVSPMQPPSPYGTPTTFVLPSPQQAVPPPPPPSQFSMIPNDNWLWKIGDLCLAKYWDDGRYYEAEITAVSENTCVVFFLGYGNHEEVLKSDCLPLTDVNHRPINSYHAQQQQQHMGHSGMQANPFQRSSGGGGGGGGSQRYRGERQVYVPPHKREN